MNGDDIPGDLNANTGQREHEARISNWDILFCAFITSKKLVSSLMVVTVLQTFFLKKIHEWESGGQWEEKDTQAIS